MSVYNISIIYPSDQQSNRQVTELLFTEGIRRDANLDYTCGIFDDNRDLIATGSCFSNTLRCMAVSSSHQGEGLMNQIVSHLIEVQFSKGNSHIFLYTKCSAAKFFSDLGFYEIIRIQDQIVFMENKKSGFSSFLKQLCAKKLKGERIAALVMNANPFTLGHQYLIEKAAAENDLLHLFIVCEDTSLIPFTIRKKLVMEGTSHLNNICYHESGPYIISNATFPSYFQKDDVAVIESHAMLDLTIFIKIAQSLNITRRYVGEESTSLVTGIYNQIMQNKLPEYGIECIVVPRKEFQQKAISASTVRQAIKDENFDILKNLVPKTTLNYFLNNEAKPIIQRIQNADNVIHY
jgi:[citrate (pro-3S)-lyase] ligase